MKMNKMKRLKVKMMKMKMKKMKKMMMMMIIMEFLQGYTHCFVAPGTQMQFGLGSLEPRQDSACSIEQAREPPAATKLLSLT